MLAQFQSDDRVMQMMQNSWAATLNPVITNNNAIGNFLKAQQNTAVTLSATNTIFNITNLVVPPGIWLIWSFISFPSLPSNTTETITMISTSPTTQSEPLEYTGQSCHWGIATSGLSVTQPCGPFPAKLLNTTKYFLNAQAIFTGSNPTAKGTLYAMQLGVV